MSSSELVVLLVSQFAQLDGSLLGLVEVVVHALEFGVVVLALALSHGHGVPESVDLVLVLSLLLSQLGQFVLEVVGVLPKLVDSIALLTKVSLKRYALLLPSTDLVSDGANFSLVLVVGAVFLIEQEPEVLNLLPEVVEADDVLVVAVVVVIVLHQFLVLEVTVLLLDGVELVSQSQVVLVSLLDLEDLCFELGDEQVLLVTGEMD